VLAYMVFSGLTIYVQYGSSKDPCDTITPYPPCQDKSKEAMLWVSESSGGGPKVRQQRPEPY
jgi:hypothetical protein